MNPLGKLARTQRFFLPNITIGYIEESLSKPSETVKQDLGS